MRELDRALAPTVIGDVAFGKATIREPVLGLEFIQQFGQRFTVRAVVCELVCELVPAVFAPRQQTQCTVAQRRFKVAQAAADFSGEFGTPAPTPTIARILASISCAIAGRSFRYSRALSLP